jgi:hypothetical protein
MPGIADLKMLAIRVVLRVHKLEVKAVPDLKTVALMVVVLIPQETIVGALKMATSPGARPMATIPLAIWPKAVGRS